LIFEADQTLGGVPFDVLVDERGHYLSERAPILNSLGSYYRRAAKSKLVTADSTALIVAVPSTRATTDAPLAPLPDVGQEAEVVARNFRRRQLLIGSGATLNALRRYLAGSEVFHFAGHAAASTRFSGLFLEDALFGTPSLGEENLAHIRLAVLSGCDTLGEARRGDEPDGLARAFMDALVPHIVASRWSVDSAATRQFMGTFYRSLLAGDDLSNSVRQAQVAVRSMPGMEHPYYWSAFGAYGTN